MEKEENTILFDLEKKPLKSEREEIRRKRKGRILAFLLCLFFFLSGIVCGYLLLRKVHPQYSTIDQSTLNEVKSILESTYLYKNDYEDFDQELNDKALYGITYFSDDPYTTYMSKEEINAFADSINGNYVGIGVEYTDEEGQALIVRVFHESPAEKAGILPGDIIKAVDGNLVDPEDSEKLKELVLGEEGTEVVLTVERGNETFDLTVTRGAINSTVFAYTDDDILILELNSFGDKTSEECAKYLDEYPEYKKLIIDLRNNSGGYQTSVRKICGLFIGPNQVYLRQMGANGVEMVDYTSNSSTVYDKYEQVVLLVNGETASAAEVFAIVMKEKYPNVTIVGTTTYGKGVIQSNRVLLNGGVLKYTNYYWYSPNGVSIHNVGIEPDVEVYQHDIFYQYYYDMAEDEKYELDSVSEAIRIAQLSLDYLGYDLERTDGYFDLSFAQALIKFKSENGLSAMAVLDKDTYKCIVNKCRRELNNNSEKDLQLQKAKELLK